jgi:hypothetical protein
VYTETRTARRLPPLANREDIPADELDDFELVLEKVRKYSQGNSVAESRNFIDGQPYGKVYWEAFGNSPRLMMRVDDVAYKALYTVQDKPGHPTAADHHLIDLVHGFDSGYWGLHGGHVPNAVSAGVRIEAIEAIAEGREDELSEDERQQLEFIRAVRDGGMTDDIWDRMIDRVGTVAGVIEYANWVLILNLHHKLMWALGVPALDIDAFWKMIAAFRDGSRDPAAATQNILFATRSGKSPDEIAAISRS